tara:strand:+ start:554 stop:697 length:144 start_codon:yes stop_codon:yes gene_type:complete
MNDLPVARQSMAIQSSSAPAGAEGFLGGMDLSTISALVVLASAFMRR